MLFNTIKKMRLLGWLLPLLCFSCKTQTAPMWTLNLRDLGGAFNSARVQDIQFSPDGKRLLVLSRFSSFAYVWDMLHLENSLTMSAGFPVDAAAWSPDGSKIVTGVKVKDGEAAILVWDASDGKEITDRKLTLAIANIPNFDRLGFSKDGRFLFAENKLGVFAWEFGNRQPEVAVSGAKAVVPYGVGYAYILAGKVYVHTQDFQGSFALEGVVRALATADGGLLLLSKNKAKDQLCLLQGAKLEMRPETCPLYADIQGWYPSEDGSQLILVERSYTEGGPGRVVFLPDTSQPGQVVELGPVQEGEQVLLSAGGGKYVHNVLRSDSNGGAAMGLYLKDARTGQEAVELDAWPQATLQPWQFSSNGNRFAATLGEADGQGGVQIRVWDVKGL